MLFVWAPAIAFIIIPPPPLVVVVVDEIVALFTAAVVVVEDREIGAPPPPPPVAFEPSPPIDDDVVTRPAVVPMPLLLLVLLLGTTGISWERRIRFELCILTATETEERSPGNGLSTVSRVMINEHSLQMNVCRQREREDEMRTIEIVSLNKEF